MSSEAAFLDLDTIGEDVPLLEGLRTTCAIRRFRTEPVPRALVRKVVEAGTFAPSGGNRQPWIFVAVTDAAKRAWVAQRYRRAFASYIAPARRAAEAGELPPAQRRGVASAIHLADTLEQVPVHLFVAGWTRRGEPQTQALFPAIQNILLACRAVGLGACLTQLHLAFGREVDAEIGLPPDRPSVALLPIGWPAVAYRRPERKPVDSVLFWERYVE
jgi:nitroreductase